MALQSHLLPPLAKDEAKKALTSMRPGFHFRSPPAPYELREPITPDDKLFQTIHMGAAVVDPDLWTLTVEGMVERPFSINLKSLKALASNGEGRVVEAFHECYGSPLKPPTDFVRRVGCVRWTGLPLRVLLDLAKPTDGVEYVWSSGLDHGTFAGVEAEEYQKDLPISKAMQNEVLVAWAINGEPLDVERGGPVRLVVPGWFGTNFVKWLLKLCLRGERSKSPFTTKFYNELVPGREDEGVMRPVWEVEVSSIIVSPAPGEVLAAGVFEVWGWAWGGEEVRGVGVRTCKAGGGGDGDWRESKVESRRQWEWQRWSYEVELEEGEWEVIVRADGYDGSVQPMSGRRNQVHKVKFCIR